MSKNIIIQEGGSPRQFTADRLRTGLVEGGTCIWVPEDEVMLGRKTITQNGTYLAADDGLYGFSRVTVRGIGTAKGRGSDGRQYTVRADEDGNLTYTALAERIRVSAMPEVVSYGDGACIDFAGLVVTACDADGADMFEIPFDELIFPVTVADLAQAAPGAGELGDYALNVLPVGGWIDAGVRSDAVNSNAAEASSDTIYMFAFRNRYGHNQIEYFSRAPFTIDSCTAWTDYRAGQEVHNHWSAGGGDLEAIGYYHTNDTGNFNPDTISPSLARFYTWQDYEAFFELLRQERSISDVGGQEIPVRWAREGDGEVLETTFNIAVIPAGGHGEE